MRYTPRTEKDIRSSLVAPPGEYDFEVVAAKEKVSKSGNDMIELELCVFCDGVETRVKDWLVPGSDLGDLKLNRFSHSTGLEALYFETGLTAFACQGVSGRLKLTVESSEQYGDQNKVKGYIVAKDSEETSQLITDDSQTSLVEEFERARAAATPDDDVPF